MGNANELSTDCAATSVTDGIAYIESASPLTRLHYFDGKFLKADALSQEQEYHRTRVRLSNQAGGWGVVNGLGIALSGAELLVDGGLAITPAGNFVMNVAGVKVDLNELLKVAEPGPVDGNDDFQPCVQGTPKNTPNGTTASGLQFYEITVGPIDTLCGNEPVYGKLCESACVSDSRHPYWREGMVLRLRPISLKLPNSGIGLTKTHLRNRMASAYFAIEPGSTASQLSKAGLASNIWCGTASLYGRDEVVIGLLSQDGNALQIDAWAGRRERMDTQARGYWQGRLAMRPFNVFLAQILQFQCQLSGMFGSGITFEPVDDCDDLRAALAKARKEIELLHKKYKASSEKLVERFTGKPSKADAEWVVKQAKGSADELYEISQSLDKLDTGKGVMPINRLLLNNGFQQLPPAGFLPVELNQKPLKEQIGRWFGEGVRLHYHAVRADEIGHLVEQAQHMERISLTRGLDDPKNLEDVEIFLPDGRTTSSSTQTSSTWWQVSEDVITTFIIGGLLQGETDTKEIDPKAMQEAKDKLLADKQALRTFSSFIKKEGGVNRLSFFDPDIVLKGLARTDARADGSFGITLVAGTSDQYQVALSHGTFTRKELAMKLLDDGSSNNSNEAGADTPTAAGDELGAVFHSYLAADIDTDPFALEEGQIVPARAETHMSMLRRDLNQNSKVTALTAQADGGLTIASKKTLSGGLIELVVEVSMSGQVTSYTSLSTGKEDSATDTVDFKASFKLTRQTGTQGGTLAVQLVTDKPSTPGLIKWQRNPVMASFRIQTPITQGPLPGTTLQGLSGVPAPKSALRSNTNKLIDDITNLTLDPSFGLRAQHRLFDDGPVTTTEGIEATQDWLMFRRARTLLCDPDCKGRVESTDEAVQVWHIKVADAAELKKLVSALEHNTAADLADFDFNEIGVLHYPDESIESVESTQAVHTMWELAKPGNTVVAGRTWERQPATGQGWQNHTRVFKMLQEVSDLITPPDDVGQGVIKAVKQPPAPLIDGTLDGGMLVVTMDTDVAVIPHRVLMLPQALSSRVIPTFTKDPDKGWIELLGILAGAASTGLVFEDVVVNFKNGKLDSDSLKALDDKRKDMADQLAKANNGAQVVGRYAVRVTSKSLEKEVHPIEQHKAIMEALVAVALPGAPDHFDVAATNLGSGAEVASLVFFDINQVSGPA
jgi:hypothetical protein